MQFNNISEYIQYLVDVNRNATIIEFATELHNKFYSHIDISFMNEFFDIASEENEGKFVVDHQKLIDYGVVISNRSNDILNRLTSLGLVENEDYLLRDIPQQVSSGTKHIKKYKLTPEAFFLALQRAKRAPKQTVDPTIYAKYFQFLQKVVKYYDKYQIAKWENVCKGKDENIIQLNEKIDKQTEIMQQQTELLLLQSKENKQLLAFGEKAAGDNAELKQEIHKLIDINELSRQEVGKLKDINELTNQKVDVVYNHLIDKSKTSTKNPKDKKDVHHVIVMDKEKMVNMNSN